MILVLIVAMLVQRMELLHMDSMGMLFQDVFERIAWMDGDGDFDYVWMWIEVHWNSMVLVSWLESVFADVFVAVLVVVVGIVVVFVVQTAFVAFVVFVAYVAYVVVVVAAYVVVVVVVDNTVPNATQLEEHKLQDLDASVVGNVL
jgi:hypothetical protein